MRVRFRVAGWYIGTDDCANKQAAKRMECGAITIEKVIMRHVSFCLIHASKSSKSNTLHCIVSRCKIPFPFGQVCCRLPPSPLGKKIVDITSKPMRIMTNSIILLLAIHHTRGRIIMIIYKQSWHKTFSLTEAWRDYHEICCRERERKCSTFSFATEILCLGALCLYLCNAIIQFATKRANNRLGPNNKTHR